MPPGTDGALEASSVTGRTTCLLHATACGRLLVLLDDNAVAEPARSLERNQALGLARAALAVDATA